MLKENSIHYKLSRSCRCYSSYGDSILLRELMSLASPLNWCLSFKIIHGCIHTCMRVHYLYINSTRSFQKAIHLLSASNSYLLYLLFFVFSQSSSLKLYLQSPSDKSRQILDVICDARTTWFLIRSYLHFSNHIYICLSTEGQVQESHFLPPTKDINMPQYFSFSPPQCW
jgi:hypothetical protein